MSPYLRRGAGIVLLFLPVHCNRGVHIIHVLGKLARAVRCATVLVEQAAGKQDHDPQPGKESAANFSMKARSQELTSRTQPEYRLQN
jgi:hypothetical protein